MWSLKSLNFGASLFPKSVLQAWEVTPPSIIHGPKDGPIGRIQNIDLNIHDNVVVNPENPQLQQVFGYKNATVPYNGSFKTFVM